MPQTRFVLSKALEMNLVPIVVINKIDRPHADPDKALDLTFDLFVELGASDEQLDFAHCYASGLSGFAVKNLGDSKENMGPLLQMIVDVAPAPTGEVEAPFLLQTATISYDDFVGRQACGRILSGTVKRGDQLVAVNAQGDQYRAKVTRLKMPVGLTQVEVESASTGDIVTLAGFPDINAGDALCSPNQVVKLPPIKMAEPTVSVDLSVNSSPFVGRAGEHVTMNKIRERLEKECRSNISLKVSQSKTDRDSVTVSGRGELHIAVLIESMRREGFELSAGKPRVITKEVDGKLMEPVERVTIEVPEEHSGAVIEELSRRKGELVRLQTDEHAQAFLEFLIPTRGLMGYHNDFMTITRGEGILHSLFDSFVPWKGELPGRKRGVLISMCSGKATAYSLFNLQPRGTLFVNAGDEVYEGMIVGEHNRPNDLVVNVVKGKQLTNVRASGSDENVVLTPPRVFTLERAIDYIESDEMVEVTPKAIRLRKAILTESDRKRASR